MVRWLILVGFLAAMTGTVAAQFSDEAPPIACGDNPYCTYSESAQAGLRFQTRTRCGGVCTTQYWVRDLTSGAVLLSTDHVAGGVLALPQNASDHPPIRLLQNGYEPGHGLCCPSYLEDTWYVWDGDQYVAGPASMRPLPSNGGDTREQILAAEQLVPIR